MTIIAVARDQLTDLRHRRAVLAITIGAVLLVLGFVILYVILKKLTGGGFMPHGMSEEEQLELKAGLAAGTTGLETFLYAIVSFAGVILSLVVFSTLISGERARGTIHWVLARPLSPAQLLLGKWLGACAMMLIYTALISVILIGFAFLAERSLATSAVYACLLMFPKFVLVGSVALALAMLIPPPVAGVIAYFAGAGIFQTLAKYIAPWPWLRTVFTGINYLLPNYGAFTPYLRFLLAKDPDPVRVLLLALYAVGYSAVMLLLAIAAFRRRDVT
jgi:ABC-type transport system involved in multi-copper enzyme maturation permease subunit